MAQYNLLFFWISRVPGSKFEVADLGALWQDDLASISKGGLRKNMRFGTWNNIPCQRIIHLQALENKIALVKSRHITSQVQTTKCMNICFVFLPPLSGQKRQA